MLHASTTNTVITDLEDACGDKLGHLEMELEFLQQFQPDEIRHACSTVLARNLYNDWWGLSFAPSSALHHRAMFEQVKTLDALLGIHMERKL